MNHVFKLWIKSAMLFETHRAPVANSPNTLSAFAVANFSTFFEYCPTRYSVSIPDNLRDYTQKSVMHH